MNGLLRHLQLRPHGDRLLTSSAAFWLFSARVLVLAMAIAEALAWGYLGFLFGEGWTQIAAALFAGTVMFLVVWMIDASLITLDRSHTEHSRVLLSTSPDVVGHRSVRQTATFVFRIVLLIASLTITAPYLAQLVFRKDIEQRTAAEATTIVDGARDTLRLRIARADSARRGQIATKRAEYEREIAGRGLSGRFGAGPTAVALRDAIVTLEAQSTREDAASAKSIAQFDSLAKDWQQNRKQLAARYNAVLPRVSILQSYRILTELRERPEFQRTELAIKAFLAFIFAGLLLLKLFEPSSVRLYMSEALQQEYDRYLAGTFDALLPPTEVSTATRFVMTPQRFYEFLAIDWASARRLDQQFAEKRVVAAEAAKSLDVLEKMRTHAEADVTRRTDEMQRLWGAADEAAHAVTELQSAIAAVRADTESFHSEVVTSAGERSTLDEKSRLEYRSYVNRKLSDANRALRELEEMLPSEIVRRERARAAALAAEAKLAESEKELASRLADVREVRSSLAKSAGEAARIAPPATDPKRARSG